MEVHLYPPTRAEAREVQHVSLGDDRRSVYTLIDSSLPPPLVLAKEHKRIGWRLLIPALVIFILSIGFAILILSWVTFVHGAAPLMGWSTLSMLKKTGSFLVDESIGMGSDGQQRTSLRVLTFTSITTQIVYITSPLLVMMTAYSTAGDWVAQQGRSNVEGKDLPTPAQFGLLVKMSSTSGLVSMYETARYLVQKGHEPVPPLFKTSMKRVVAIFATCFLLGGADLWLHASSSAAPQSIEPPRDYAFEPSNDFLFGFDFNTGLCEYDPTYDMVSSTCFQEYPSIPSIIKAGTLIAQNASLSGQLQEGEPNPGFTPSVITLREADDLAVITATLDSSADSWTWLARTLGVHASCDIITDQCQQSRSSGGTWSWNCSAAGYPDFPPSLDGISRFNSSSQTPSLNGVVVGLNGTYTLSQSDADSLSHSATYNLTTNPFTLPIMLGWNPTTLSQRSLNTKLVNNQSQGFAVCEISTIQRGILHDLSGNYNLDWYTTLTPQEMANLIAAPFFLGTAADLLPKHLESILLTGINDDEATAALNQELARLILSGFAGGSAPYGGLVYNLLNHLLLSEYPAAPFFVYIVLLLLYSAQAFIILLSVSEVETPVVRCTRDGNHLNLKEVPASKLGHDLLTDPMVMVGLALPHTLNGVDEREGEGMLLNEPIQMFGETNGGDVVNGENGMVRRRRAPRLMLDVVDEGPKAGMVFGVREWTRSR